MEKRTMKPDFFVRSANVILFHSPRKIHRRWFTVSLLLLFGATFTVINGQTVNYTYDANGNVISKKVTQPLNVTNFTVKQDSVPVFANYLAYYSPFKTIPFSDLYPVTWETVPVKTPDEMDIKAPLISSLPDAVERYPIVVDKKKNNNPN